MRDKQHLSHQENKEKMVNWLVVDVDSSGETDNVENRSLDELCCTVVYCEHANLCEMDGHLDLRGPLPADVRTIHTNPYAIDKMVDGYFISSLRESRGSKVWLYYCGTRDSVNTAIDSQNETAEARS